MANKNKPILTVDDKVDENCNAFKKFDIVDDHSDHYYSKPALRHVGVVKKVTVLSQFSTKLSSSQPSKFWANLIQHEWKVLEKDLPGS